MELLKQAFENIKKQVDEGFIVTNEIVEEGFKEVAEKYFWENEAKNDEDYEARDLYLESFNLE